jgi:hypothetical protein
MIYPHQFIKKSLSILTLVFCFLNALNAEFVDDTEKVCGKIDVGPTALRVELMDCGKRHKKLDMYGYRADACWVIKDGWCVKPVMLMGWGEGSLYTLSCAFGRCIPLCDEKIIITPCFGFSWSYLTTEVDVDIPLEFGGGTLENIEEKFRGTSPFLGIDVLLNLTPCWRVCGSLQYGWSRSWTKLKGLHTCHSNSKGPTYGFLIERDINKKCSINLGFGYNCAYSKDKSGLKGKGAKLGFVYWF